MNSALLHNLLLTILAVKMDLLAQGLINMSSLTALLQGAEPVTSVVSSEAPLHPLHRAQPHNSPSHVHNCAHASSPSYLHQTREAHLEPGAGVDPSPFPCRMRNELPCITLIVPADRGWMSGVSPCRPG